ncbi:pyridoxamine 5'-phosphate oxidase-related FMN-binding protein [Paenibacillus vortex V453]|jgi:PPOX class probable FMN-dependent enzyme|uniref:Phosphohydrolase n=2 Tax=Paenibacillus TaxID=44249 RepID=A0A163FYS9_9BACL|nr:MULTISPECIES: pyridoxamine 5'-phosphate oxidase family protein [Paenibacillus]MCA4756920.1 pyridoxamine 5'-phosphate oxidase family protein [Mycolicibacterium fortuitum]ANA79232.1 phosphohydrolase [Paenibacillus glucanolyticus]AVV56838.1 pyridoxamine 5'-phosphate oxidase family protein [Paenibacillus glucanolyticus]AWP25994.1 phosphohydrolase [Paenibacillus sp. Cedars]EFU38764.1 pyridoxamine 5'-phosphate oxidase-related FMN-binding protein [Paenibacillus vortex V453]
MIKGPFQSVMTSEEELRGLFGESSHVVKHKTLDRMDHHCKDFIAKSPLLFMATSDASGYCDVSPRGDAAGFVHIMDESWLVIPERPGNRRFDSLRNILSNPRVGLVFVIPGLKETLRINGSAVLIRDEDLLDLLSVQGKRPWLGIGVRVEECFIHCAKAFMRSQVWDSGSWLSREQLPNPSRIIADHVNQDHVTEESVAQALQDSYKKRLY